MNQELENKLEELEALDEAAKKAITDAILKAGSADEILVLLKNYGIDAKLEDFTGVLSDDELTEDALENVAGGKKKKSGKSFSDGLCDGRDGKLYGGGSLAYTIGWGLMWSLGGKNNSNFPNAYG